MGIECRSEDTEVLELLKVLEHIPTRDRCLAERSLLRELEGGCQVPIGVSTSIENETLTLTGMVASLDGQRLIRDSISGNSSEAETLGRELAIRLRDAGAGEILAEILAEVERD